MAFTPVDTPLQYQYKPLNLMAFAEPLMKMQEKYDLTKSTIEDSDVKATALQWAEDPEKAKALEQVYRAKRDELVQNLIETKNYTEAANKIKKLQKLWLEDPERIALETNYKTWEERDKEEATRVSKGEITKDQYLQWRADEIRKFKELSGTSWKKNSEFPTGTYNPITGKVGRIADMQKDFDDTQYKAASAMKARDWDSGLSALGIDPLSQQAKYVKQSFEQLKPEEIDEAVTKYMMSLDRFKPWLNEVAEYNFKDYKYANDNGEAYDNLSKQLLENSYNSNEQYINYLEKNKKTKTDEYKQAIENRGYLLTQIENPDEKVIKDLFKQDFLNKKYDASELGQIFKVNNVKSEYSFHAIPKGDGLGDNDITADDLATGSFIPNKYLPNLGNLNKQRIDAGKTLYSQLPAINNIAAGNYRTIVLGAADSKDRTRLAANPGAQRERQQRIFTLALNSSNSDDFYKKLISNGFTSGVTKQVANAVFSALQNKETRGFISNQLLNSEDAYNKYNDAKQQQIAIDKSILQSPEFKYSITELGDKQYRTDYAGIQILAKRMNTTVDKLIKSRIVEKEVVTGEGYNDYNFGPDDKSSNSQFAKAYFVSGNNLAIIKGYKNLKDAVNQGVNISNISSSLGNDFNKVRTDAIKKISTGQIMSFNYVGDKKVNTALSSLFTSIGNLNSFVPVESRSWDNVPGFDEDGNLLPGTSFDFDNGQSIKLIKHANQLYYEVPLNIKTDNGTLKNTVLVKPKPGTEAKHEQILGYIVQQSRKNIENPTSKQTYDMAQSSLYDLQHKSNLTDISAESFSVDRGAAPVVLETVKSTQPGVNFQIVKVDMENRPDVYKIRMVNGAGNRVFVYDNDGKEFTSNNVNAAKVRIQELTSPY